MNKSGGRDVSIGYYLYFGIASVLVGQSPGGYLVSWAMGHLLSLFCSILIVMYLFQGFTIVGTTSG